MEKLAVEVIHNSDCIIDTVVTDITSNTKDNLKEFRKNFIALISAYKQKFGEQYISNLICNFTVDYYLQNANDKTKAINDLEKHIMLSQLLHSRIVKQLKENEKITFRNNNVQITW